MLPEQMFGIHRSIEMILAPIVGGLGTVFGPIVGAFVLTPMGEALIALADGLGLNLPGLKAVVYGLALILIVKFRPGGIWPWMARKLGLEDRR
jgi:branched-chain amino acid transport system permease protein